jgi:hypothetical protein
MPQLLTERDIQPILQFGLIAALNGVGSGQQGGA